MEIITLLLLVLAVCFAAGAFFVALKNRGGNGSEAASPQLEKLREDLRGEIRQFGVELRQDFSTQRGELAQAVATGQQQVSERLATTAKAQADELAREREARVQSQTEQRELLERSLTSLADRLHKQAQDNLQALSGLQQVLQESLAKQQQTLATEMEKLRQGNEAKLEKMRETVDEKLQGTLEKRLGESFRLVSERLEKVQHGLGEMQSLAGDVGSLKRVLSNVKTRGIWGEVQLGNQIREMLTPEQFAENIAVLPNSQERVEFAIKLPGKQDGDAPVWLPIDSKFPQESYEKLLLAQEEGDAAAVAEYSKALESDILKQAKLIRSKYVAPPHTTDFAVMYLPTEGLFAEVLRMPGLVNKMQNELHITVAGPTVLMSLLNSLQLGFRTLAIEKRSAEVWELLAAAKLEFNKYGEVWKKLEKQLQTAQNTVSEAGRRTRVLERSLRSVESLEAGDNNPLEKLINSASLEEDTLFTDEK